MIQKFKEWMDVHFDHVFLTFLFCQPFIDVATFFSIQYFHLDVSFGMVIRFTFLFVFVLNILFRKEQRTTRIYLILVLVYMLLFEGMVLSQKGIDVVFYETKVMLRTFYFPILLVSLIPYYSRIKNIVTNFKIIILYSIYLFFIFVPNLLGLGLNSYTEAKEGMIGWFNSANEIGAILSILMPFVFAYFLKTKKYIYGILYLGMTLFILFSVGTKVPIFSFMIVSFSFLIYYFYYLWKRKKIKVLIISSCLIIIGSMLMISVVPKTSFYKNLEIHMDYLGMDSVTEIFTNFHYLDHFVFSERLTLLMNSHDLYKEANISEKFLGIGYIRNYGTDKVSMKLVEMDYYDIFYCHGIIGAIIYFLPLLSILIIGLKRKNIMIHVSSIAGFLSVLLILLLAFFSGHVLISPAVSFYSAFLLLRNLELEKSV